MECVAVGTDPGSQRPLTLGAADAAVIERFADALWMERGLSANTLSSYQSDLRHCARWLRANPGCELLRARRDHLLGYLAAAVEEGVGPRTSARRLSTLRQFFQWALREQLLQRDPTAQIEAPRLGRPLPKSLSEREVEALLEAPDTQTAEGMRDRAMLEVLYATGLRVSELVGLQPDQLSLSQGLVRVVGKGGKERLVPLGDRLGAAFPRRWQRRVARWSALCGPVSDPARCRHDATGFLVPDQEACARCRDPAVLVSAYPASRLRDPPGQSWRGPARGPAAAGTQFPFDHPDLYPRRA